MSCLSGIAWLAPPARRLRRSRCALCSASACGIDLGTTTSAVAIIVDGRPVIVPNTDGGRTTPSVVAYLSSGEVLTGRAAVEHGLKAPRSTFSSVKRFIGRQLKDVAADAARVQFEVAAGPDGAAALVCPALGGRLLRPEELSAQVLRPLLAAASSALGETVVRAVVTVPAYFDQAQRQATVAAGLLAGLERVKLVREPVAAALAYGCGRAADSTVLVVDLGGGTFDVSVLEVGGGCVEVLATSGDPRLGGDDFDDAVARWLAMQGGGGGGSPRPRQLQQAGRALREALTARDAVTCRVSSDPQAPTLQLRRAQFEALAQPLLMRLRRPLEAAAWTAGVDLQAARAELGAQPAQQQAPKGRSKGGGKRGLRAAERAVRQAAAAAPSPPSARGRRTIDTVLLVGGATRMPAVQRFVSEVTARPVALGGVDPDEAVALGAALHAGCLDGSVTDLESMETWQATLMRALVLKATRDRGIAEEQLLDGPGAQLARSARTSYEEEEEDTLDALEIEDILALGSLEDEVEVHTFEDKDALHAALGDAAFAKLQGAPPPLQS